MPTFDSIQTLKDSITVQPFAADTDSSVLMLQDSVKIQDVLLRVSERFIGLIRPSSPQSEAWVFVTLLVLLFLFSYSYMRSSGWLIYSVKSFFRLKERSSIFSKTTVMDFVSQAFLILFTTGVFSLYIYLLLHEEPNIFTFVNYSYFLATTATFIFIKFLLIQLTGYVFANRQKLKIARESYFNILIYLAILLFPLLVFRIYAPESFQNIVNYTSFILVCVAFLLLIIKLFQIFFENIADSFYLLLYLCTLEILPFLLLLKVYNIII